MKAYKQVHPKQSEESLPESEARQNFKKKKKKKKKKKGGRDTELQC